MTSGFPLGEDLAFPRLVARRGVAGNPVNLAIKSLRGFTCVRAEKWVHYAFPEETPDYTILQFGSTDASLPLREILGWIPSHKDNHSEAHAHASLESPPSGGIPPWVRWWIKGGITWLFRIRPRVAPDFYATTMARLASDLSRRTTPVILSPFVMGDPTSLASARRHTKALAERVATIPGVIFVNAFEALSAAGRPRQLLMPDGLHLNATGHQIVARMISTALDAHAGQKALVHFAAA